MCKVQIVWTKIDEFLQLFKLPHNTRWRCHWWISEIGIGFGDINVKIKNCITTLCTFKNNITKKKSWMLLVNCKWFGRFCLINSLSPRESLTLTAYFDHVLLMSCYYLRKYWRAWSSTGGCDF